MNHAIHLKVISSMEDTLSKVESVKVAINVLNQALKQLNEYDYSSAQVMVAIARQTLDELQLDFGSHFRVEGMLQQILK